MDTQTLRTPVKESLSCEIWWAQQLLWKCTGLCLLCTHRHLTDEGSRQRGWCGHQTVHERALKEKSFDRKFVSLSPLDKKKKKLMYVQWNSGEVREIKKKKKISDIVHGGMFGARMWCYHSDGISPWRVPGRCAAGSEAWSRLIALSWMTCSCLQLKAAPKPRDRSPVTSALFPLFPTDVASQSRFVLWWDEYDVLLTSIYTILSLSKHKSATGWLCVSLRVTAAIIKCVFSCSRKYTQRW